MEVDSKKLCPNCFRETGGGPCPGCGYDPAADEGRYPLALRPGSVLNGKYIVGRVLGQGGFGVTYLAWDHTLEIKTAIKEFLPEGMASRTGGSPQVSAQGGSLGEQFRYGMDSFLSEARVLAKFIGHPNIVGIRGYFQENGTAYLVMEYVEGVSFKEQIARAGGRVGWREAVDVLRPVMEALSAVHEAGILHRDVTPDNIYLTGDGSVKLLDFGAARYNLGDKSRSLDVILKSGYAPKEQYSRKGKQGPYTDVYSVAACLYAAITGCVPPEALERIEEDDLIPICNRGVEIPPKLDDAILKGLEINASDRFQTMAAFLAAVEAACRETEPAPAPDPAPDPDPVPPAPDPDPVPPTPPGPNVFRQKLDAALLYVKGHRKQSAIAGGCLLALLAVILLAALGGKDKPAPEPSSANPVLQDAPSVSDVRIGEGTVLDNPDPNTGLPDKPAIGLTTGKTDGDSGKEASGQSEEASKEPSEPEPEEAPEEEQPEEKPTDEPEEEPETEPETPSVKLPTPAAPTEPEKPAQPEKPAEPLKPVTPEVAEPEPEPEPERKPVKSKDELQNTAKALKDNKKWTEAADVYREMRSLGYITESELANQLELLGEGAESAENYQTAAALYQGAVDLGNTEAALWLGWLYMKGDGMAMDEARGLALFERAANSGYNVAYHSVATSYEHGWGTPVDLEKALYWYQKYYEAFGNSSTKEKIDEITAQLNPEPVVTRVSGEPYTMVTSEFSVTGVYTGEWKDGKPNGEGVMSMHETNDRWDYGDQLWSADWVNGLIEGYGEWTSAVDGHYSGNFSAGLKSGYGKMWFSDGTVYDGQWSKGAFVG